MRICLCTKAYFFPPAWGKREFKCLQETTVGRAPSVPGLRHCQPLAHAQILVKAHEEVTHHNTSVNLLIDSIDSQLCGAQNTLSNDGSEPFFQSHFVFHFHLICNTRETFFQDHLSVLTSSESLPKIESHIVHITAQKHSGNYRSCRCHDVTFVGNDEPCGFLLPSQTATEKYAVLESLSYCAFIKMCSNKSNNNSSSSSWSTTNDSTGYLVSKILFESLGSLGEK